MAGQGTRLRPHTLTVPKPLIQIAGKSIVQHLTEEIARTCHTQTIENIGFIVGNFGTKVEKSLLEVAQKVGAKGYIYKQTEALGTAHAILCAQTLLQPQKPVIIAFADTLFKAHFEIDNHAEGTIWTKEIENPEAFGVVTTNAQGIVTQFVEKPKTPVSNQAIIGIYHFKNGEYLKNELQYLIDNNIKEKNEFLITTALENMCAKGTQFKTATVQEWLDCGNKEVTVYTNQRVLEFNKQNPELIDKTAQIINSQIIMPCYVGANTCIQNSIIGPHVSVGDNTTVQNSIIQNSIIQNNTNIKNKNIHNSMIGSHVTLISSPQTFSIGDYSSSEL